MGHPRWSARSLELLVEIADGTGDVDSARNAAFPILHPFHNAGCLVAFGTLDTLCGVNNFRTIGGLRYLGHDFSPIFSIFAKNATGRTLPPEPLKNADCIIWGKTEGAAGLNFTPWLLFS